MQTVYKKNGVLSLFLPEEKPILSQKILHSFINVAKN